MIAHLQTHLLGLVHVLFALAELLFGSVVILNRKGIPLHRWTGRGYVVSMLGLNLTELLDYELFGRLGPFHWLALACQVCHIPAIARAIPTRTEWYWADAGRTVDPIPVDPVTGKRTYDKMKGTVVWSRNVRPTLRYANGKWNRMVINANDKYDSVPIDLGSPQGGYSDPAAMIYPFKMMIGNQPVDPNTRTVLVPHLFGMAGGPNPYWGKYDWAAALADGAAYTGQDYSGSHVFEETTMLLSVNHEVAPKEQALGVDRINGCLDCHASEHVDWPALGWTDDPLNGGERVLSSRAPMLSPATDLTP